MSERAALPGETIAYRGDGSTLVFDYVDPNGLDVGHVVMPDGVAAPVAHLVSILAHGYWTAEPDG